jgi:hypothetical protein
VHKFSAELVGRANAGATSATYAPTETEKLEAVDALVSAGAEVVLADGDAEACGARMVR